MDIDLNDVAKAKTMLGELIEGINNWVDRKKIRHEKASQNLLIAITETQKYLDTHSKKRDHNREAALAELWRAAAFAAGPINEKSANDIFKKSAYWANPKYSKKNVPTLESMIQKTYYEVSDHKHRK